jgi:HEPN domain-containing protein
MTEDDGQALSDAIDEVIEALPSRETVGWLRTAEEWFGSSRLLTGHGMYSHVCEGSRHSVELALKAVLVDRGAEQPPHLTSLLVLGKQITDELPRDLRSKLVKLDHYYYEPLYPTELSPQPGQYYEEPEATEALQVARELIDWARALLPEAVVRQAPREDFEAT